MTVKLYKLKAVVALCQLACAWVAAPALAATGVDIFRTDALTSSSRTGRMEADIGACATLGPPKGPMTLARAVEYALCNNPRTQREWQNARAQAAAVGAAKAAYLPTISASVGRAKQKSETRVEDASYLDTDVESRVRTSRVDLNMVLFDFGARSANLDYAREMLKAANAAHDEALQSVFVTAAQAYYDAITAQHSLVATRQAYVLAEQAFRAADARHKVGTATVLEKLQAETNFEQARLRMVQVEGENQTSRGVLAQMMGFAANTPLELDNSENQVLPNNSFIKSVNELIDEAKASHPQLLSARAQLEAAKANERATRAQGLPTLSLTGGSSNTVQPTSQLGLPPLTTHNRSAQIGIQLNIPLFEGFGRNYRVRQAQAQAAAKAADVEDVELQVAAAVWKNYQLVQTAMESVKVSSKLRGSAAEAVQAAQARYQVGATPMLDLVNMQTVLANADQHFIQAISEWRTARLRLAYSLGMLGVWAIR